MTKVWQHTSVLHASTFAFDVLPSSSALPNQCLLVVLFRHYIKLRHQMTKVWQYTNVLNDSARALIDMLPST
jgi:hypothetical protein